MSPATVSKRLFVGGLANNVTPEDIHGRFSRFGKVTDLSLKTKKDDEGNSIKSFAHLSIEGDEANIKKCFDAYQNTKWKGGVLSLQYAKESFLSKLAEERKAKVNTDLSPTKTDTEPKTVWKPPDIGAIKGSAVPGTAVPGMADWVVGKYGRVLPVLKLKKARKISAIKHDPSKLCHTAKVFKEDAAQISQDPSCGNLTWEINTPDSEVTKKRKGELSQPTRSAKKRKGQDLTSADVKKKGAVEGEKLLNGLSFQHALGARGSEVDFEVVRISKGMSSIKSPLFAQNRSNQFDSDMDSDAECELKPYKAKLKPEKTSVSMKCRKVKEKVSVSHRKMYNRNDKSPSQQEDKDDTHEPETSPAGKAMLKTLKTMPMNDEDDTKKIPEFRGLRMLELSSANKDDESQTCRQLEKTADIPSVPNSSLDVNKTIVMHSASHLSSSVRERRSKKGQTTNKGEENEDMSHFVPELCGLGTLSTHRNDDVDVAQVVKDTKKTPRFSGLCMLDLSSANKDVLSKDSQVHLHLQKHTDIPPVPNSAVDVNKTSAISDDDANAACHFSTTYSENSSKRQRGRNKDFEDEEKPNRVPELHALGMLSSHRNDDVLKTFNEDNMAQSLQEGKSGSNKERASCNTSVKQVLDKPQEISETNAYDSDSSADTDEILVQCRNKKKKTLPNLFSSALSSPKNLSVSTPRERFARNSIGVLNNSTLDRNIGLSEFTAAIPDQLDFHEPNATRSPEEPADSYDSDLDSNDFELVAKKLAQKAKAAMSLPNALAKKGKMTFGNLAKTPKSRDRGGFSMDENSRNTADKVPGTRKHIEAKEGVSGKQDLPRRQDPKSKQEMDNEKRLQVVKEKMKAKDRQQAVVQKALQDVDNKESKRIVFSSDEDSDDDIIHQVAPSGKMSTTKACEQTEIFKQGKDKLKLFDSSSDDSSDEADLEEMFKSKPQFEGKKGVELMRLERKIGDSRFKLDEKFVESDSDEEVEEEKNAAKETTIEGISLENEKAASLKVLENVVGKATLDRFSQKIQRNTKHIIDMNTVRFDPTKMLAQPPQNSVGKDGNTSRKKEMPVVCDGKALRYDPTKNVVVQPAQNRIDSKDGSPRESKKTSSGKKASKSNETASQVEEESLTQRDLPRTDMEKNEETMPSKSGTKPAAKSRVQLSSSLVNLFKKRDENDDEESPEFSVFAQLNESDPESEKEEEKKKESKSLPLSGLFAMKEKAEFPGKPMDSPQNVQATKVNESVFIIADEEEKMEELSLVADSENEEGKSEDDESTALENEQSLFLKASPGDEAEQELLDAGRLDIRYTKEQWLQRWEEIRPILVKTYKKKHKDAVKSKKAHSEMKRKKEFLKNSKKKHWSRFKK